MKQFNITKTDLKNSRKGHDAIRNCLLAATIKRTIKPAQVQVGFSFADIDGTLYDIPPKIQTLIFWWADGKFDEIATQLPIRVQLTKRPSVNEVDN